MLSMLWWMLGMFVVVLVVGRARKTYANTLDMNGNDGAALARDDAGLVLGSAEEVGQVVGGIDALHLEFELVLVSGEGGRVVVKSLGAVLDASDATDARSPDAQLAAEEDARQAWQDGAKEEGCGQEADEECPDEAPRTRCAVRRGRTHSRQRGRDGEAKREQGLGDEAV